LSQQNSSNLIYNLDLQDLEPHIYFDTPASQQWLALKNQSLFLDAVIKYPLHAWDEQALHIVFTQNRYTGDNENLLIRSVAYTFIHILPIKTKINLLRKEQKDWLINPYLSNKLVEISTYKLKGAAEERLNLIAKECPFLLSENIIAARKRLNWTLILKWIESVRSQMHIYGDDHFKVILPVVHKIMDSDKTKEGHKFTLIVNTIKSLYDNPQEQAKAFLQNFNQVEAALRTLEEIPIPTLE